MSKTTRKSAGQRIIAALSDLADSLQAGTPIGTLRTVELPDDPGEYDAAAVRATREALRVSQAVFARMMGVSTILVRSWENGARVPSRMARRLLDEIHRDPARWAAALHRPRSTASATGDNGRPATAGPRGGGNAPSRRSA